ncbi:ECF RNA polymerase sigma factor SigH [Candidatus Entotheonellaceae bacterium PAL068K]
MDPIWRRANKRTQRRFEQELLAHLDALYGYALSLTRNPAEAEDLVQETCLRAISRAQRVLPAGNLKAWLFTILRNVWINQHRRRTQGPEFLPLATHIKDHESQDERGIDHQQRPDMLFAQRLLQERLRDAIAHLPEGFREVIVLRYIEGFSYTQIAELLTCPAGTVMSRISRARAALHRLLCDEI